MGPDNMRVESGGQEASGESTSAFDPEQGAAHVTVLRYQDKEIYLVGTAHVSKKSVEEVDRVIREVKPDTVCVELDEQRYRMLLDDSAWRKLDLFQVIRQKRVLFLLASLALSAFQKKMGEKLGVRPGAELLSGVRAAEAVGAELVLADRDVQATLKRTWANLSFWDQAKMSSLLLLAPFSAEELEESKIEELKERDSIGEMLKAVADEFPRVKVPLIDERDAYLMSTIQEAQGKRIVGVVGAAHVPGMVQKLGATVDREALSQIPPPSWVRGLLSWLLPVLVVATFFLGSTEKSGANLGEMLYAWILPTGGLSALFTLAALGHPLTILTALFMAPLTTLHPALGVGMFTGLVEAWTRKPTVGDCENLQTAITSLGGIYRNKATRVLLVSVTSSIGAALGMYIGATWLVTFL